MITALLLDWMGVLGGAPDAGEMHDAVGRARQAGLATAIISNAGAWEWDHERDSLVDEVVLSGVVGLRKPDPRIYLLAAERLGRPPGQCVVIDDLTGNARGAVLAGMTGIVHRSAEETIAELTVLAPGVDWI
ncbi:MAG: HAD-IA family hydrolase [Micrococcales bacterium]|nr:HAD-IA family hydrolase [Micrococcales bacterium]